MVLFHVKADIHIRAWTRNAAFNSKVSLPQVNKGEHSVITVPNFKP